MSIPHIRTTAMVIGDIITILREVAEERGLSYSRHSDIFNKDIIRLVEYGEYVPALSPFDVVPETHRSVYTLDVSGRDQLPIYQHHANPMESEDSYRSALEKFRDSVNDTINNAH